MVVQTFTLKEFQGYINNLPTKLEKEIPTINKEMADSVVRRLRFHLHEVSGSSTGNLRASFKAKSDNKDRIKIYGARYWKFLNEGRFPRVLPAQFIQQHMANPGMKGQSVSNPEWIIPTNKANMGFADKAIESAGKDSLNIIERGLSKAFSK